MKTCNVEALCLPFPRKNFAFFSLFLGLFTGTGCYFDYNNFVMYFPPLPSLFVLSFSVPPTISVHIFSFTSCVRVCDESAHWGRIHEHPFPHPLSASQSGPFFRGSGRFYPQIFLSITTRPPAFHLLLFVSPSQLSFEELRWFISPVA